MTPFRYLRKLSESDIRLQVIDHLHVINTDGQCRIYGNSQTRCQSKRHSIQQGLGKTRDLILPSNKLGEIRDNVTRDRHHSSRVEKNVISL